MKLNPHDLEAGSFSGTYVEIKNYSAFFVSDLVNPFRALPLR